VLVHSQRPLINPNISILLATTMVGHHILSFLSLGAIAIHALPAMYSGAHHNHESEPLCDLYTEGTEGFDDSGAWPWLAVRAEPPGERQYPSPEQLRKMAAELPPMVQWPRPRDPDKPRMQLAKMSAEERLEHKRTQIRESQRNRRAKAAAEARRQQMSEAQPEQSTSGTSHPPRPELSEPPHKRRKGNKEAAQERGAQAKEQTPRAQDVQAVQSTSSPAVTSSLPPNSRAFF